MNLSIATYAYHGLLEQGLMDVFACLETVRFRHDVRAVDLWTNFTLPLERTFDPAFQRQVRAGLAERGLVHANYCVDGCHFWWDETEARQAAREVAEKQLRAGIAMAAQTVRVDAGGTGDTWTDEQFDYIVQMMRELCVIAGDHGVRFGPENHWGPEKTIANMERLARAVDHPAFGILIHVGGWNGGSPDEGDKRLAPWAMHTHIDAKTTEERLQPAIRALVEADYAGYWGIEHHSGRNEYAEVAYQVAAVQRALTDLACEDPERKAQLTGGVPDHIGTETPYKPVP